MLRVSFFDRIYYLNFFGDYLIWNVLRYYIRDARHRVSTMVIVNDHSPNWQGCYEYNLQFFGIHQNS
jgi:hypothetical protein